MTICNFEYCLFFPLKTLVHLLLFEIKQSSRMVLKQMNNKKKKYTFSSLSSFARDRRRGKRDQRMKR